MKQQVRKSVTANVHGSNGSANRIVLVGTYKGDQLAKWRGWYDWPISEDGFSHKERKEAGGSQLVATESADAMNCVPPDFSQINQFETVWSDFSIAS